MTDIPIIFSAPMVRALLIDRKSMTRRPAWRASHLAGLDFASEEFESFDVQGWNAERRGELIYVHKPSSWQHVKAGDRLWVRENWRAPVGANGEKARDVWAGPVRFEADGRFFMGQPFSVGKLRPAIHMPRGLSRLTLVVTATKIERLQEITEAEALVEGINAWSHPRHYVSLADGRELWGNSAREAFSLLWKELHGAEAWDANPEVVALAFQTHKQNIDALPKAAAA